MGRLLVIILLLTVPLTGCLDADQAPGSGSDDLESTAEWVGPWTDEAQRPLDEELARTGSWLEPITVEEPPVHATLLADGRLLVWGVAHEDEETGSPFLAGFHNAESRVYDLSTDPPQVSVPTPSDGGATDLFCADQNLLADGRVVAFGGSQWEPLPEDVIYGTNDVRAWDPLTNTWEALPAMAHDRWYPSSLTLPDGRVLIAGGYEVPMDPSTNVEAMELFEPATGETTELPGTANRNLPMYPRLYTVPSGPMKGDVFYQPAGCLWCPGGNSEAEPGWNDAASFDPATNEWTTHEPALAGVRNAPVTALLPLRPPEYDARILTAAGTLARSGAGVPLAEITDLTTSPPSHAFTEPMEEGRWFPSHVTLPDGNVLVTGGAKQDGVLLMGTDAIEATPVLSTELFEPSEDGLSGTWTTLAPMTIPRVYHSTSLLLPDGRVVVAGSVPNHVANPATEPTREKALEVFEPPYLFRGDRPVLERAPARLAWDEAFTVETPDAQDIAEVVLVRAGTVTHVYNPEQRMIELELQDRADGSITAQAPPDAALAPPGTYMLFLIEQTDQGPVPSVAAMVQLGSTLV